MSFLDVATASPTALRAEKTGSSSTDPSHAVTAGVFQMNTSVNTYKRLVNTLGTPKDTPELRNKLQKTREQIAKLAKDVSAKLKAASESDKGSNVSPEKLLSDAKLAKDLQAVMKEFQKAQKTAAEREAAYVPMVTQVSTSTANEGQDSEAAALLANRKRQQLVQLDNEVVFHEAVIEERDAGIREIQGQIKEVNDIFKDLAVLVHEQGNLIDDIDSNIEGAFSNVSQGNRNLISASRLQKSSNSMACCLLVFFSLALVILVLVLTV